MTTKITTNSLSTTTLEQAADWVLAIQAQPEQVNSQAFTDWLYGEPAHLYAFEQTAKTFELAVNLPVATEISSRHHHASAAHRLVQSRQWLAMAATALICVSLWLTTAGMFTVESPSPLALVTVKGQVTPYTLPDSSVLHLDTDSRAEADINDRFRKVTLLKGRVFADVARDPSRIFSVAVNDSTAFTALGTAYSVEKLESSWTLRVYEGVVGVTSTVVSHPPVRAGWGLTYAHQRLRLFRLPATLTPGVPDWQSKQIQFKEERLASAIRRMNDYTEHPVLLADPRLAAMTISGVFSLTEPDKFVESVSLLTGTKPIKEARGIVLVSPEE